MSITMTTTASPLGVSNLRGSSTRQTRTNPSRTSKIIGSALRQNSLVSNNAASVQGVTSEPHGFYPAITHFADAVAALPRDYRRHTSLLKEADAKAWAPEETLHKLLEQCLKDQPSQNTHNGAVNIANAGTLTTTEDAGVPSAANSVIGTNVPDNISLYSSQSADPVILQRRQLYAALRHNLVQIMITMDEKNHVINNANDELLRHVRRLDNVWPHIIDEISEEARLGSLKHWAYTETNPTKKSAAATTRREVAVGLAIIQENDVAHRSESRREAMLAKKQRNNLAVDSDFDEPKATSRKGVGNGKRRAVDTVLEVSVVDANTNASGKRKKPDKLTVGGVAMQRSVSSAMGGRPMSREPSQQESKKRKAPATTTLVARKRYVSKRSSTISNALTDYSRLIVTTHDSPKLASSPLATSFIKEPVKPSPALTSARMVSSKSRQSHAQNNDSTRARPSSSTSHRHNGHGITASTSDLNNIAAVTGKSTSEVKHTMKETVNHKGDRLIEEDPALNGESLHPPIRGGLLLERTSSKSSHAKAENGNGNHHSSRVVASPRLPPALVINERTGRGRASKHSTPIVDTFAEAEAAEGLPNSMSGMNTTTNTGATSNGNNSSKSKRPARPRLKDHHGLHDSLSPRGLPMKRSHKKSAGMGSISSLNGARLSKEESDVSINATEIADGINDLADEEDDNAAEDEERYCYCHGVSYGEMVACDNKDCPLKWFHLACIGLRSAPRSAKWYCEDCKEGLAKRGKFGSVGGNGNGHAAGQ